LVDYFHFCTDGEEGTTEGDDDDDEGDSEADLGGDGLFTSRVASLAAKGVRNIFLESPRLQVGETMERRFEWVTRVNVWVDGLVDSGWQRGGEKGLGWHDNLACPYVLGPAHVMASTQT
jgi:hypothetical protein